MRKIFFLFFFLIIFFSPTTSHSANFFATVSNLTFKTEELVQVDFFIDTQNQELNALEGFINYPTKFLKIKDFSYGNSIISHWIEKPQFIEDEKIFFSGIIPGGFNESPALLFSIVFQTIGSGKVEISFKKIKALQNDGYGTPVPSFFKNLFFNIQTDSQNKNSENTYENLDKTPPEIFQPIILEDDSLASKKKFLIFNTTDKDSGIAHYEVLEEKIFNLFSFKIKTGHWQITKSPHLLKDQTLKSNIYIKAIDRAGNFYIASILLAPNYNWYTNFNFWSIIVAILLLYIIRGVYVHYNKKNKNK